MSTEKIPSPASASSSSSSTTSSNYEVSKGFNGLDKVILRDARGSSAECRFGFAKSIFVAIVGWGVLISIAFTGSPASASSSSSSTTSSNYEVSKGFNGLDKVILRHARGSSAEVYLYGGQVTSWKNDQAEELLFLSSKAIFKPPKAIRGGIPLCFPQFSNLGPLDSHGFARNRFWTIDDNPPPFPTNTSSKAFVDLILKPSEDDIKIWPHSFEFRLRVALGPGGELMLTSRIRNTNNDGKPFSFTFAYHTYFSVSDISEVRVEGLETLDYLDNLQKRKRFTEQGDALTFESEVDRIYLSTPTKIAILDHEKKRTFVLRKDGLPDSVVWNPWDKKAKSMPDFGDDEYKHMLCVEAAAIEKPITLKPGEEWKGRLELSTVPSSYRSGQLDPRKVIHGS
ncbi:putative glucose-6-phosphate 1-epimerase isoform X1 [Vigna radiata var. radiata]|uniref:glucose-6-phosphate 1-epimerase n=1 Tax=Vigna radiata var. radiata TaxID=3916 RepID=A0A1S3USL8_VIGRR|nr:putative glucose-6-phosphate 1-epimerase isoform X1 [Vigna radiata var. radiata]XP_022639621.1 putative glucose-6-phosphate 1-epimerase isoform X1 [Vigna radiata var. radiata]